MNLNDRNLWSFISRKCAVKGWRQAQVDGIGAGTHHFDEILSHQFDEIFSHHFEEVFSRQF